MKEIKLAYPGPAGNDYSITTQSGQKITIEKDMAPAIEIISSLGIDLAIQVLGFNSIALEALVEKRKETLSETCEEILKGDWIYPQTGEKVVIDQDFIEDFLGVEIKLESFIRKIRDRRLEIYMADRIIKLFQSDDFLKQ